MTEYEGRKPEVVHFQRRQRGEGNFSLEFIFEDVRKHLSDKIKFKVVYAKYFSNGIWKRLANLFNSVKHQGEINHVTGDIHYINLLFDKKRTILTVLDCGFMYLGNPLGRSIYKLFWLTLPEKKSKYITAISTATKSEIVKFTGCDPSKIFIIPVAVSELYQPQEKEFNAQCPVLLQIGTSSNKNIARLAEGISGIDCKLVIVGRVDQDLKKLLEDYKINYRNKINLSMDELYNEYVNCDIVTFVSTFEGFGMPIIEGNCVERVVITGNTTSMPEVGGNAAHYVDPFSVDEIRKGIHQLIRDADYRKSLIENGRTNKLRFSNEKIAHMYYDLYLKLWNENPGKV